MTSLPEMTGRILRLTPALEAELEWLAAEGPPNVARHARMVLGRARGLTIRAIAAQVGVHANTVRNCVHRFETKGLRGLAHGSAGKPKSVAFTEAVREEIARLAMRAPNSPAVGESYTCWSLRRLREHLIRRGVVPDISVEGLRQLLRGLPLPPAYWRRGARPLTRLSPEVQNALENWARGSRAQRSLRARIVLAHSQGLNETEIAAALHIGRGTVRRWLARFRQAGILGLQSAGQRAGLIGPNSRRGIIRMAMSAPQRYGFNQSVWDVETLRQSLLRSRTVREITVRQLAVILKESKIQLPDSTTLETMVQAPAVGD